VRRGGRGEDHLCRVSPHDALPECGLMAAGSCRRLLAPREPECSPQLGDCNVPRDVGVRGEPLHAHAAGVAGADPVVAKNAILLLDFAKSAPKAGADRREAIIEAGRTRLRPIIMTGNGAHVSEPGRAHH
jgi:hypothetical protein